LGGPTTGVTSIRTEGCVAPFTFRDRSKAHDLVAALFQISYRELGKGGLLITREGNLHPFLLRNPLIRVETAV
jgi:hypothetical protein